MNNARILFEKLSLEYINANMMNKEFETNWMDCKEKEDATSAELSPNDKKLFAKALSGFANTSGGVILFGIRARPRPADDVDIIIDKNPIKGLKKYESNLREIESRIVERLVKGVEYLPIETSPDEGVMAVYIPESEASPHRSVQDYKFYIRAGGTFNSIDLKIVEDLFHKTKKPDLQLLLKEISPDQILILLRNNGKGIAKYPSFVIELPQYVNVSSYRLDGNKSNDIVVTQKYFRGKEGKFAVYSGSIDNIIHADGGELPIINFSTVITKLVNQTFTLPYYLDAENMQTKESKYTISFDNQGRIKDITII
ncbi:MAG: ATP-binding protein [Elusimicrobia bacterium]|nr:ATP-binding protein [Elusimicrobiota bacterium]